MDMISRQAAIDALHMDIMYRMGTDSNKKRLDEWINNLPSAQPERKAGKWLERDLERDDGVGCFVCSECGEHVFCFKPNFCENCGADMRPST